MSAPGGALITGGAGFVGSHLAELLLGRGERVSIIDDLSTGSFENVRHLEADPNFRFAIDSITDDIVMDRLVSECDVIYHMAAAVGVKLIVEDPVRVIETNILGTHHVLKLAHRYRKKVMIASTSEIYGKSEAVPFGEDSDRLLGPVTKARWSYSSSKAVDEFLALAYHNQKNLPVVVFRLFNTVGPRQTGQYGMVVPRFVRQAVGGEQVTVYGDGEQRRCFCNVKDVVRAIVGLADAPEAIGRVFNIGSTEEVSILELARRVLLVAEAEGHGAAGSGDDRIVFVPYEQAYESGFEDMLRRVPDTTRIHDAIGWSAHTSLDDTLAEIVRHVAAQPAG